ncbi:hypothetical protein QC761_204800 [Podospora bellae-mahoneyi]|uniref:NACHT domain-containing protein n=1 Tax=Podospora bellae-mahoneyi TaxID=2093777 RepID=A0ABR0FPA1_9PEZI|nr:hypothetical protein QC761_204800 [Podospora bellae-mahoneyi]
MDPLTSISLVANVAAFVDFGFKIVSAAREVQSSTSGTTATNVNAEVLTINFRTVVANIKGSRLAGNSQLDEARLAALVDECERLSDELLGLLDSLRARKPGSKRHVFVIAWRNMMKRGEKEVLEARLDRCRNQLQLEIAQRTSEKSLERLEAIAASGECQTNELAIIKHSLHDLHQLHSAAQTKLDSTSFQGLNTLLKLCGQAFERVALSKLLSSIGFEKMSDRLENIAEAHATTFNWLVDASEAVDPKASLGDLDSLEAQEWLRYTEVQDSYRKASREALTSWLLEGNGIFHIFGKPGSGKSTLLKHLLKHPAVQNMLEGWAGGKALIKCSFFFWKGGSVGQKTFSGLYRSLLCSVFKQCPELVPSIVPSLWQLCLQGGNAQLTDAEARHAFLKIMERDEVFTHRKFVFFIDGLDEFEGDDTGLVRTFLGWTRLRPDNIKICVSSRELPLFQERFSSYPKLRLHEVTSLDIMGYVKSTLEENEDLSSAVYHSLTLHLGQKIIEKAEGVLLWVSLVLRIVERGLLQEDNPEDLEAKIDGLPTELETLFQVIFKAIETEAHPIDRRRAMLTLAVCLERTSWELSNVFLHQLSFLDEYESDCNFLFKSLRQTETIEDEERLRRCRKQVNGRCRGLVSVTASSADEPDVPIPTRRVEQVAITHRSLIEFFSKTQVREVIEAQTQGFNMTQFTSRSFVAQQMTEPDPSSIEESHLHFDILGLFKVVWYHDFMNTSIVTDVLLDLQKIPFLSSSLKVSGSKRYRPMDYEWWYLWRKTKICHSIVSHKEDRTVADIIIFLALKYGLPELLTPPEVLKGGALVQAAQKLGPQHLLMRIFDTLLASTQPSWNQLELRQYDRLLKTMAMCLRDGASPNLPVTWQQNYSLLDRFSGRISSLWEVLIWTTLCGYGQVNGMQINRQTRILTFLPIWVLFLAYGADTEFKLKVDTDHAVSPYQDAIRIVALFGKEQEDPFTPLFIPRLQNLVVDMASKQNGLLSLSDIASLIFPDDFHKFVPLLEQQGSSEQDGEEKRCAVLKSFGLDLEHWDPPPPSPVVAVFPEVFGLSINKCVLENMGPYAVDEPQRGIVVYTKQGIELLDRNNPAHDRVDIIA